MIPAPSGLKNISVLLVETLQAGNVGSAARAMKNMGLHRLKLVNPPARLKQLECLKMAGKAGDLVENAAIYTSFEEAVADENVLVGTTSARDRKPKQRFYTPRQIAPLVREYARSQRVALIFGPENRGLTDDQLAQCQYLVFVPANPEYPVVNVAQTVMILAYEIFNVREVERNEHLQLVPQEQREEMFAHLERVLIEIGFLSSGNPAPIMKSIRRFLGRADLTARDLQIIRGMMSQMEWYAKEGHRLAPEEVRKP